MGLINRQSEVFMTSEKRNLNKKQRRILWAAAIAVLIGILSLVAGISSGHLPDEAKDGPIPTYTGHLRADQFMHPHPDEDITTDAVYMELDRRIHIRRYFETVRAGDAQAYNSLFTDTYYKRTLPFEYFSPQKIYDIVLQEAESDPEGDSLVYYVSYAIYDNDGTFRRDVASDASRVLIFTLVDEGGTMKIDSIGY